MVRADPPLTVTTLCSLAYVAALRLGLPLLLQDWPSGYERPGLHPLAAVFAGWEKTGTGMPQAYPLGYLVGMPLALVRDAFGGGAELYAILLTAGALAAFGARAVAKDAGGGAASASAAALFSVTVPWGYSELIAGHGFMLVACGASLWLLREILRPSPRRAVLVASALLTTPQIQFGFVGILLLAALAVIRHRWQPFAIVAVAWLPVIAGVVAEGRALQGIPFVLSWEHTQSVAPLDALQLNGYFARYGDAFRGWFSIPMFAAAALTIPGLTLRNRKLRVVAVGTLAALIFAMGTKSVFGPVFSWAVENIRPIALYRELYDVLGYVAIGYIFLASATCARWRWAGWIWLATSMMLPVVWILHPPSQWWVPSSALPQVSVPAGLNTRFALVPVYQPMSFNGRGSGADPDAYSRPNNVTPLNEYLASYPVDAALSSFLLQGRTQPLEALSVSSIIERPWLQTDMNSIENQWALPSGPLPRPKRFRVISLHAFPELALLRASEAEIDPTGIDPVIAPNREVKAARDWVDARLAFAERPDLAQPYGGALTTNPHAQLQVRGGVGALVFVQGALRASDGRAISATTHGYRWVMIPSGVSEVTCSGLCVVAVQGKPAPVPSFANAHRGRGVGFNQILPWLAVATVPPGASSVLRYNVAYDPHWAAYLGGRSLPHVELEGIVNGWMLPARSIAQHLVLIHIVSLIQLILEIFAIAVITCVGAVWLVRYLRARRAAVQG